MAIQFPPSSSPSKPPQQPSIAGVDEVFTRIEQYMTAAGNQNTPAYQQLVDIKAAVDSGQERPVDALNTLMTLMMRLSPPKGSTTPIPHTIPVQPPPVGTGYTNTSSFTPPPAMKPPPAALTQPPPPSTPSTPKAPGSEAPTVSAGSFKRTLTP